MSGSKPQSRVCQYVLPEYKRCGVFCCSQKVYREHALRVHGCHFKKGSDKLYKLPEAVVQSRLDTLARSRVNGPSRARKARREAERLEREETDRQIALAEARREREKIRAIKRAKLHLQRRQSPSPPPVDIRAPRAAQGSCAPSIHFQR